MSSVKATSPIFQNAWQAINKSFADSPPDATITPCDSSGGGAPTGWTVAEVKALIKRTNPEVIERMCKDSVKVGTFDTAYDKWKYKDGREEENELKGLRGNTEKTEKRIRLRKELSNQDAAATLFHEMAHWKHPPSTSREESLQEEIDVRVEEEHFRSANGMPPATARYRTEDGKANIAAIDESIRNSAHYNPVDRTRIGRRYINEQPTTGWCPP